MKGPPNHERPSQPRQPLLSPRLQTTPRRPCRQVLDGDHLRVSNKVRPRKVHIAEHVVGLQLKLLPLAPPLGFVRPKGENHGSHHADEANDPRARCLDPVGADWLEDQ